MRTLSSITVFALVTVVASIVKVDDTVPDMHANKYVCINASAVDQLFDIVQVLRQRREVLANSIGVLLEHGLISKKPASNKHQTRTADVIQKRIAAKIKVGVPIGKCNRMKRSDISSHSSKRLYQKVTEPVDPES